ncbi:MAG: GAF domain-containing protein [Anaerolineae bacterium]|nr:GAF domain-containing protein [Anaerolineae bacterium]
MDSLIGGIIIVNIVVLLMLAIYSQLRRKRIRSGLFWLMLSIVLAVVVNTVYFWPLEGSQRTTGLIVGLAALVTCYGMVIIRDIFNRGGRWWLLLGSVWVIALALAGTLTENVLIGQPDWLLQFFATPDITGTLMLSGLAITTLVLLGVAFYGFYVAALPEVANRALFWVLNTAGLLVGVLLAISGSYMVFLAGMLMLVTTVGGAVYGLTSYRVFDIRLGITTAARVIVLATITAAVIFLVLNVAETSRIANTQERTLMWVFLAALTGTLYVIISQMIGHLLRRLYKVDPTHAARRYSQQVSRSVDLNQLLEIASETLNTVMAVRRSGMLLVNDTSTDSNRVQLVLMNSPAFPDIEETRGYMSRSGGIYQQLAVRKLPLAQFDIERDPQFADLPAEERMFFHGLQMSAYAPIIVDEVLLGILMCGPKVSDAPYYEHDLELLATMADQTGVALRNARSVADLRHLNMTMLALNADLEEANEQLEKLDSVKTDFITIASHELRTPLAQMRGYTDILDALNEQGMLDKDQIAGMVANLRKAAERTETLLSDMLFVSQLDVDAMDLRFTETSPESVLRMAIEPLTDPLNQRKLSLSARGLRGLPTIYADMQRLVQAFRNIVVNAIKFTPDRGRIEINAGLNPVSNNGETQQILIAISDTGVGIEPENLELIFEKFYRAYDPGLHSTGTYKFMGAGPGLGLTIARGVIESHGGKIWAKSSGHNIETCPGTTFYILLPVVPPENAKRVLIEDKSALQQPTA